MLRKNDQVEIAIENLGAFGEGVGRIEGMPVFVEGGLPGDLLEIIIVKVKKSLYYGKQLKIISPSPDRTTPVCPVYKHCGGCQLQHLRYSKQLEYKQDKLKNALQRIGGLTDITVENTIGMDTPFFYRNKAQFPIVSIKDKAAIGLYARRSHQLTPVKKCFIQTAASEKILNIIEDFANEFIIKPYDEKTHTGLLRHVLVRTGFRTEEIMVCIVINGESIPHEDILVRRLTELKGIKSIILNSNLERTNVVICKKAPKTRVLYGTSYIADYIGSLSFQVSPFSFFQVNPVQTKILYDLIFEAAKIKKDETVFDLFCGVGTISLYIAEAAKMVYGIESVPEAIADANINAALNNINNVEFLSGKAEELISELISHRGIKPDVVILDPPRKGCDKAILDVLAASGTARIVYVSCEPSTLARDLKILTESGYRISTIQPVDCFPQTEHVETVVLLTRRDG